MAIYKKASTSDDIVNGLVTVATGGTPKHYDPSPGGTGNYSQHFASGDALRTFVTLDGRYKTGPSGWSS